jgi:hypothetical protein
MMVFSIPPICAPNRPDASLPGYHNQTDPLVSEPSAGVALTGGRPGLAPVARLAESRRLGMNQVKRDCASKQ